ncbi:hypothetical protein RclHR1_00750014 [Rhizophagus clarus]|uniref:Lipopolysaccharide-induced tumor necrosis factor-alpha factor homolog n=1 Tax=Rhizophagus clarus TaxID=94130 RepID=A0A2Z6SCE0_9GLOM|nr:hypothetical protein RclHR1_00750014 [Rhizophagus clarus]GES85856.1 lipopolysaccharide-induced tumor necrosis factor-alpha factor homolog [Rhizophagus clarus]
MTDPGTNISNPEPAPPPSTPPNDPSTRSNRGAYDGGANENTPLISNQPERISIFQEPGHIRAIPIGKLRDDPKDVKCPHCSSIVKTIPESRPPSPSSCYRCKSNCSLRCCLCYTFTCFIPFCIGKSKDVIHSCPNCKQFITKYTHFDNCCGCC